MSGGQGEIVVVPRRPGPLIRPGRRRRADDLDDLIDELLPDTAEGPGPVDAALVAGGGAFIGWAALGSPPVAVAVAGALAVGLGCILPVRAGWRAITGRRRAAVIARGVPLVASDPAVARLVAGYEALDEVPATTDAARAAAHGAVLEVASLLDGRAPESERERRYVDARTAAVQELVRALQDLGPDAGEDAGPPVARDLVVEAREELDALGGVSALSRLDDVTEEVRARGRRR